MAESGHPGANDPSSARAPRNTYRSERQIAWIKQEMLRLVSNGYTAKCAAMAIGVAMRTVNDWKNNDPEFKEAWRNARIEQTHCLADEIIDIADEPIEKGDMAAVQRNRLRCDSRKWFCSKVAPKFYGDKLKVNFETDERPRGVIILPALDFNRPLDEEDSSEKATSASKLRLLANISSAPPRENPQTSALRED